MPDGQETRVEEFAPGMAGRIGTGPGEAVLWVHGYTLDATVWAEIWSELPGWTHVGVDLPGHGSSSSAAPGSTLRDLGDRLADAALRRGIRHVVGLSLGSMFALQVVLARPSAFTTLTLAAPALAGGPVERDVGVRYMELHELYRRRGPGPWMTELWMRTPPETFAHADEGLRSRLAALVDRHTWREFEEPHLGISGLARQAQDPRELAGVAARLMILIGEHELDAFRKTARILHAVRPDARVVTLDGAGHLCLLHVPEYAARLLDAHWRGRAPIQGATESR